MKVEKISDTQVKFFLSQSDLNERSIDMSELAFGSEKAHALFREMMKEASIQCDFDFENSPIMIEAITLSAESLMIVVTKITNVDEFENKLSVLPRNRESNSLKVKEHFMDDDRTEPEKRSHDNRNLIIYSFSRLDDAADASYRLYGRFNGTSILFKEQNLYYLVLHNDVLEDQLTMADLEGVLGEYGQKHVSTLISKYYLWEHGEMMIRKDAVQVLAENM